MLVAPIEAVVAVGSTMIDLDPINGVGNIVAVILAIIVAVQPLQRRRERQRQDEIRAQIERIYGHTQQLTPNHGGHIADKVNQLVTQGDVLNKRLRRIEDGYAAGEQRTQMLHESLIELRGRFEQHIMECRPALAVLTAPPEPEPSGGVG